jgi:hypothetical protein
MMMIRFRFRVGQLNKLCPLLRKHQVEWLRALCLGLRHKPFWVGRNHDIASCNPNGVAAQSPGFLYSATLGIAVMILATRWARGQIPFGDNVQILAGSVARGADHSSFSQIRSTMWSHETKGHRSRKRKRAAIGLRFLRFPAARLKARRLKSCCRISTRHLKAACRLM